jgi:hypothetical protein
MALLARAALAEATFQLAPWEQWQHQGNGNGPVHLVVGEARVDAKPGQRSSVTVAAHGPDLIEASVSLGGDFLRPRFLLDVEDGHHYTVEPDPCCFFQIGDDKTGRQRCVGEDERCPSGLVGVDKFHSDAGCGGREKTCAAPTLLRVAGGVVEISLDGDEPRRFGSHYQRLPLGRAVPMQMSITRDGVTSVVWALLRLGGRYTLFPGATPRIVRDR